MFPRNISNEQGLDRWDRNAGDYAYPGRLDRADPPHQTESKKAIIVKVALISIGVLAILYLGYTIGHSDGWRKGWFKGRLEGRRKGFNDGIEFEKEYCLRNCTETIWRMESDRNRITRYDDFWLY